MQLAGSATVNEAELLQEQLALIADDRPACVVIDMSKLDIITSLCIGVLVSFRKTVLAGRPAAERLEDSEPGLVVVAGASPFVNKSLAFARLDQVFKLYPDVDSATAALRGLVTL